MYIHSQHCLVDCINGTWSKLLYEQHVTHGTQFVCAHCHDQRLQRMLMLVRHVLARTYQASYDHCKLLPLQAGTMVKLLVVLQFLIILCVVGLDVGIQTTNAGLAQQPKNHPLIISNSVGLVVMLVWSLFAYRAVKHEDKGLAWLLTVVLPIMYILPVVDIVLGESVNHASILHGGRLNRLTL